LNGAWFNHCDKHMQMHRERGDDQGLPSAASLNPESLQVTCNGTSGTLLLATSRVKVNGQDEMSANKFENFAGAGKQKNWKSSVRIVPGQVPECPEGIYYYRMPASNVD
jgi:hypothetical protein